MTEKVQMGKMKEPQIYFINVQLLKNIVEVPEGLCCTISSGELEMFIIIKILFVITVFPY